MKKQFAAALLVICMHAEAQIGIGTTSPNSTLDVRGSLSNAVTTFSTNTTAGSSDNMFIFSGTSATTLTLPTAVGITGREYWVKNVSSNSSVLTIETTSSQTIDGLSSWTLTQTNKAIRIVSNGTNWYAASESLPGSTGTPWVNGGNNVTSQQNFGTTSNYALPFITNNTQRMFLSATGNLGLGTSTFNGTNPEKFVVDAGNTSSVNAIVGKGSINSYLQLNIQNQSNGTSASSDVVATADNGSETTNYVDMGINSSTNNSNVMGVANDAYLYNIGQNLLVGTGTASKSLVFMTGGTTQSTNERMRIDGNGKLGLGVNTIPKGAIGAAKFSIDGTNASLNGPHMQFTTSGDNYPLIQTLPWNHNDIWTFYDSYYDGSFRSSTSSGGNFAVAKSGGNLISYYAAVNTPGSTLGFSPGIALNNTGKVGIGTSVFDATNPEKLLVDAGTTTSVNAIVGKGNINSYLQLNIKNNNAGAAASSDVVATANNGTETVNFIDMGINSGGYSATGILGGANNAYLYSTGNDLVIGNSTENKDVILYTTLPTATSTERLRITGTGVKVSGSVTVGYRSGTGNYTLLTTDYVVINTGAAVTWTLPAASSCAGKMYRLLNHGTGNITLSIAVNTANATTTTILAFAAGTNYADIISDGTAWRVLN